MTKLFKGNAKTYFPMAIALLFMLLSPVVHIKAGTLNNFHFSLTNCFYHHDFEQVSSSEQLPQRIDSLGPSDTIRFRNSKDSLSAAVNYHADDSMVLDIPGKKILLYGKESKVKYTDNELTSPFIEYSQPTHQVSAYYVKDSSGAVISFPTFNQGDMKSMSDTIIFNMQTMKGITKGTYTQQGEMYIYGSRIKKVSNDVFFGSVARFTTCNLDTPHFAFVSNKIKLIRNKMAITGPVHPEIEGVPLPIVLPFGIYPLSTGRHSGFMAPSFSANQQLGLALEGMGYYKVLSPNWDVILQGTAYSYGGWVLSANPRYYKRYRYQGNFAFDMQHFKSGFKGDPDFVSSQTFNVRWSHSVDSKARPGVTFNANVNAGSSKFNQQVPNNPTLNFTNQLNSSITWAKVWKDKPYNLSISANHNQNTTQRLINLNLPDVAFNVNTLYPLRRKEVTGSYKWYENLGIALNSNVRSLTSFYDTAGNIGKQIQNNWQWGATHSIPITLSLPPLGVLQVSPSVSYTQRWYQKKLYKQWDPSVQKIDTTLNKGFYAAQDISFGLGVSSRIFGMATFNPRSKVQAIRHEIRPSISASYKPDLNGKNFYNAIVDSFGNVNRYTVYEGSVFGSYGEGRFGGLSFNIDNNLQMKVRNKKDTSAAGLKKVTLLDGFGLGGNYNFLADSFKMSNLSLLARTNLFDKVNITSNANFDPYLSGNDGKRIDKLVWSKQPLSLGTLVAGSVSLSSSFRGGDGKKKSTVVPGNAYTSGITNDEYQQDINYIVENPAQFVDFSIPWSIDLSYSLRLNRSRIATGFNTQLSQDVNWNSSINVSEKWKLGLSGYYNITKHQLGTMSVFMSREMHCWQLAITVSPVGVFKYFSINLSPKSGLLRDLHINRTRYFYNY